MKKKVIMLVSFGVLCVSGAYLAHCGFATFFFGLVAVAAGMVFSSAFDSVR